MKDLNDKGRKDSEAEARIPAPLLLLSGYALALSVAMIFEKKIQKKLCLVVTEKAGHREVLTVQAETITESFRQAAFYLGEHQAEFDNAIVSVQGHLEMDDDFADPPSTVVLQLINQDSFDDNKVQQRVIFQCYRPVGESFGLVGEASLAIDGQIQEPSNDYWLPFLKEGITQLQGVGETWRRWQSAGIM